MPEKVPEVESYRVRTREENMPEDFVNRLGELEGTSTGRAAPGI